MTQFLSNNDLQFLIDNIEGTGKIHVSSRVLDENNTKAEWKVHYGDGDSRNKKGIILGEFALQKADLTGVQKVLEQAIHSNHHAPHITTDSKYLIMFNMFRERWKSIGWTYLNGSELLNRREIVLLDTLFGKFENVLIQLVPGPRYIPNSGLPF